MGCRACEEPGVKCRKGLWSPDEDQRLRDYLLSHGLSCWSAVPAKAGLQRNGKSCRLRWINYLRPGLKRGNFSREEEEVVVRLQAKLGNKWSQIAMQLPGRTDNEVKNYWNSYLKKKYVKPQEHSRITTSCIITAAAAAAATAATSTTSSSSSSAASLQAQPKREDEPSTGRTIAKQQQGEASGDAAANNHHCSLPRILFGDWLSSFSSGEQLHPADEPAVGAKDDLLGSSSPSEPELLHDQDHGDAGFIYGFDEMYEVPESSVLFDILPWCDDL